jgi:hypothetical protein
VYDSQVVAEQNWFEAYLLCPVLIAILCILLLRKGLLHSRAPREVWMVAHGPRPNITGHTVLAFRTKEEPSAAITP